jgi:hypothetical protein
MTGAFGCADVSSAELRLWFPACPLMVIFDYPIFDGGRLIPNSDRPMGNDDCWIA